MATNEEKVLEEDPRLKAVEAEEKAAVAEVENAYNGMINSSDEKYQAMIDATKANEATQTELQNKLTDQAVTEINQQKDQAQKDYLREQSGAYVDWQKQSNQYGVNAEAMASQGMTNTGYSESSQVAMYTAYQNRVATARESYNRAVLNYDNSIKEARLQNSSKLAEIAAQALETQLKLALEGFQYKNQLIQDQTTTKLAIENAHHQRYQDVLSQINAENSLAEQIRQHNESLAEEKRQFNESLAENKRQFNETMAAKSSGTSGGSSSATINKTGTPTGGTVAVNKNDEDDDTGAPSNNMKSIMQLGYGPISAARLAELIASGQVTRTLKDGQYYYSRNTASSSFNRLKNMGLSK